MARKSVGKSVPRSNVERAAVEESRRRMARGLEKSAAAAAAPVVADERRGGPRPAARAATIVDDAIRVDATEDEQLLDGPGAFIHTDPWRVLRIQAEVVQGFDALGSAVKRGVTVFGSARVGPGEPQYAAAQETARLLAKRGFDIITGGGPGIMEAGNRGAFESGGKSIGLNIVLPHEQQPNPYITPELCFQFHYFALRKMHFLMRAVALACFPGGFGTLDELFEVLTLIQTGKSRPRPILLFGAAFWKRLIDFDLLIETGMISPDDVHLFKFVETAEEGWAALRDAEGFEGSVDVALDASGPH